MKIIHTADLHLGQVFHQHTRTEEHRHFLSWLHDTVVREAADLLLVSGDVFDNHNPSAESQRMFYDFLIDVAEANPGLKVVVTAGNHDSGARLEAAAEVLRRHDVYVRGTVSYDSEGNIDFEHLILPIAPRESEEAAVVVYALPFLRPTDYPSGLSVGEGVKYYLERLDKALKNSDFKKVPVVLMAHLYTAGAEINVQEHSERLVVGGQDMVDDKLISSRYLYTALGHIHKAQSVGGRDNVRYAGSPLPFSFSEKHYQHGVVVVEVDEQQRTDIRVLPYKPLCRLISIPEQGAADATEAKRLLEKLPAASESDNTSEFPFLEIHLRLKQPEPELRHELLSALSTKAVRFCRITTTVGRAAKSNFDHLPSLEGELQQLSPLDIAQRFFIDRYGEPMSQTLVERFHTAERATEEAEV